MSAKEKGKFEDMAKQDKVRYEREMKNYIPPKGEKKRRFKDPNAPKRPPYVHTHFSVLISFFLKFDLNIWSLILLKVSILHILWRLPP